MTRLNTFIRIYKNCNKKIIFKVLRRSRKLGLVSRFLIIDVLLLLIYFSSLLPWCLKVLLAALWLIPYLGITVAKTKLTCRLWHRIRKFNYIGIDSTAEDLKARLRLFRKGISLLFSYFVSFSVIVSWVWGPFAFSIDRWLFNDFVFTGWLGLIFYAFCFLSITSRRWLIPLVSLTSPFISLSLFLSVLNEINQYLSHITGIPYSIPLNSFFDSYVYMFVQSGTDKRFAFYNFMYSFAFQLLYVIIQPVYKLEKSRLALETVAFLFGAVSVLGLLMAQPISQILFDYLQTNKEMLSYLEFKDEAGFRLFYEQTLKYVILPFSLGTTFPILIFKYREAASKSKGQKVFDSACSNTNVPASEMMPLLRKAIYFGGGSIRGMIHGHYLLHSYVPLLNAYRSRRKSWLQKKRAAIISRCRKRIDRLRNIPNSVRRTLTQVGDSVYTGFKNLRIEFEQARNKRHFGVRLTIALFLAVGWVILVMSGLLSRVLSSFYESYVSLYGSDITRAHALFVVLYLLMACLYFLGKSIANRYCPSIWRLELSKMAVHLLLFILSAGIIFFTDFIYNEWAAALFLPGMWHVIWLLEQVNRPKQDKSKGSFENNKN
ncbi:hypothetical protein P9314_04660 [Paenibacillus validus]|uniref:Uncharacterized protein n=1 Tax=Paenibacillus chartarius TaxID=747481 RepID=A0ABV6DG20_9BACL|nr:hypothetical protein [Paenibacillus validus]MED4599999.1 hypothetical protein [Paenibacillus validus]MED4605734.1 hypothetical protein [Paenibacillus validus]